LIEAGRSDIKRKRGKRGITKKGLASLGDKAR
jgi:hypothetical protein